LCFARSPSTSSPFRNDAGGYQARTGLVRGLGTPDFVNAVLEDVIAIARSLWTAS
jgi:uncharacterized membrane protein